MFAVAGHGIGGHRDNGQSGQRGIFPDIARRLQAVHIRHLYIHQYRIEFLLLCCPHCFDAVMGGTDLYPGLRQQRGRQLPVEFVILHQQNTQTRQIGKAAVVTRHIGSAQIRRNVALLGRAGEGQVEAENAALPRRAFHPHRPAHQLHEIFRYRQTQSRSAVFARGGGIGLAERLE